MRTQRWTKLITVMLTAAMLVSAVPSAAVADADIPAGTESEMAGAAAVETAGSGTPAEGGSEAVSTPADAGSEGAGTPADAGSGEDSAPSDGAADTGTPAEAGPEDASGSPDAAADTANTDAQTETGSEVPDATGVPAAAAPAEADTLPGGTETPSADVPADSQEISQDAAETGEDAADKAASYKVTVTGGKAYIQKDGEKTETVTAAAGDSILLAYDPPAAGVYYTGWTSEQVSVGADGQFVMPACDVAVSAVLAKQTPYVIDLTGGSFKSKPEDEGAVMCFLRSQKQTEADFHGERAYDLDHDGKEDVKASYDEKNRTAEFTLLESTGLKGNCPLDCTNMSYAVSVKFPEPDKDGAEKDKASEDADEEGEKELVTTVGDLTVRVTADRAFPVDTMLYVSVIQDPQRILQIESAVSEAVDEGAAEEILALDVGIYLYGEELDLEEYAYTVSITSEQYSETIGEDGRLYHFETDENSPVEEETAELNDSTLTFSTTHFSVLAWVKIAESGTGSGLYGCWDADEKKITFTRTKPEESYEEVDSLKAFIRSHPDAVFVDFACDGEKVKADPLDCKQLFSGFSSLQSIQNLGNLDTSACTSFEQMFFNCSTLQSVDLTGIDSSNVTNMHGMFYGCSSIKALDVHPLNTANVTNMYMMMAYMRSLEEIDLSSFNTSSISWGVTSEESYTNGMAGLLCGDSSLRSADLSGIYDGEGLYDHKILENVFLACPNMERIVLGPKLKLKRYYNNNYKNIWALEGKWATEEDTSFVKTAEELYLQYEPQTMAGVWIRVPDEEDGHFYRTDGSLDAANLWEVHDPDSPFKGYCLNLGRTGVGTYLDRVTANSDEEILALLCTDEEGSTHGCAPLGSNMREALITLIYYGWPNDAAGIQAKYGLTHDSYMNITQQAIWDFTDRYENKAGSTLFAGDELAAYNELVSQTYAGIGQDFELYLYSSWNPARQNLLSLMSITDRIYGGVEVLKTGNDGGPLSGAEFTVYALDGTEIRSMTTRSSGTASICRTDTYMGLPEGEYYVKETKAPAGYELSNDVFYFSITENNVIVSVGRKNDSETVEPIVFVDEKDESYQGGGVMIQKLGENSETLENAVFTIYDAGGEAVQSIRTNASGIARTGKQDLPLGTYTIKETKAPAGYFLSEEVKTFTLTEDGQYYSEMLTFTDVGKKGSIILEAKKSVKGGDLAAGDYRFELQTADGVTLQIAENDADGRVVFKEITYGPESLGYINYRIVEIVGDDEHIKYDRHADIVTVTITDTGEDRLSCIAAYDADGASFTNDMTSKKYKVCFRKYILNKALALSGATLEIRDAAGRVMERWTTEETEYETELYPGVYRLYEAIAPLGYAVATPITFTVEEDGTVTCSAAGALEGNMITMTDRLEDAAAFTVFKTDAEGAMLEGAVFRLTGKDELGQNVDATSVTDDKGQASFIGLLSGTYTLREEQAPDGYLPCDEEWTIEITYTKAITHSSNVHDDGTAEINYPANANESRTAVLENAENVHLRLVYQIEDGWDFLYIKKDNTTQTADANGKPIGNNGAISGGLDKSIFITEEYDFDGNTLTFQLVSDQYTAGYGYYAVISHTDIVVTDSDGNPVELKNGLLPVENEKISVKVSKVNITDGEELRGATMQILDKDGTVVKKWVTDGTVYEVTGLNIGETYTLHEEIAPAGYIVAKDTTFSIDETGKVTTTGEVTEDGVLLVKDTITSVKVSKVDVTDGEELRGATLQILDKNKAVVKEWVSDGTVHEVTGLKTGETFTLHEEIAPAGYIVAKDTTFSIDETGKVTTTGEVTEDGVLLVEDTITSVKVSKVDAADGKELKGATLQILDKDKKTVAEWVSDGTVCEVTKLKTGETYTLHETSAPEGYAVAADRTFTIDKTGKVTYGGTMTEDGVLLVEDTLTSVKVSKVDIKSGEELSGAELQILDKDGKAVEKWESDGEAHEVTGLKTGETYTLHEESAPDGYLVAADTTFTIDKTGKVTYSGTVTTDGVLLVEDTITSVKVSKVDIKGGKELSGATLQILDKKGKTAAEWVSDGKVHEVTGLKTGVTYTLHEESAPDGYLVASDTTFTIDETGKVTSGGTMTKDGVLLVEDTMTSVKVSKVDAADGKELKGATLQILDKDKKTVAEWKSDGKVREITGLKTQETYTLHEKTAPAGYTIAADTTFRIDKSGKVTYSGTMTKDGILLVKNAKAAVAVAGGTGVQTGDNSHMALWIGILLAACAALLAAVIYVRRRKEK